MRRLAWLWFVAGLTVSAAVMAATTPIEASMVITGTIEVKPDGSVYAWALDRQEKVPPSVIRLVDATVPTWKFEPVIVDGRPVLAKTRMAMRIVARPTGDGDRFTARVAGARFSKYAGVHKSPEEWAKECKPHCHIPPRYPMNLIKFGISGTVYLVLQIDPEGKVVNAAARQVDLRQRMRQRDAGIARKELADASLAAARQWTYGPAKAGDDTLNGFRVVMVPVNYTLRGNGVRTPAGYGEWDTYVPGPVQDIPWSHGDDKRTASNGSVDAIPNSGTPFVEDTRFVLLTPLAGEGTASTATGKSAHG